MAVSSLRNDGGEERAAGRHLSAAQAAETDKNEGGFDEFEDDINDSLLIQCTEEFNGVVPETSSEGSEAEGDIPSLMAWVFQNLGTVPRASKPPICPPQKDFKSSLPRKLNRYVEPKCPIQTRKTNKVTSKLPKIYVFY